jgi:endogenous inhibitor of DNA gyrase (YacG/DUF329 family)
VTETLRCPICEKAVPSEGAFKPFCSSRCKDVDLGKWLGEEYRVSRSMTHLEMESMAAQLARGDASLLSEIEDDRE